MTSLGRIFLADKLSSVEDIDAALSGTAEDYHGAATEYVARLSPALFLLIVRPQVDSPPLNWESILLRLKGSGLVVVPALPSAAECINNPDLLDCIDCGLFRLLSTSDGKATWSRLSQEEEFAIRKLDLDKIVEHGKTRSILSLESAHFELPSGAHTSHFLRLAECFSDLDIVDRVAFWVARDLAPKLSAQVESNKAVLLVDNPSMLVLGLRLGQLFPQSELLCHCLAAYPEGGDASSSMMRWLEQRIPLGCSNLYFVVSVSSTGALRKLTAEVCEKMAVACDFSVLYATNNQAGEGVYCALSIEGYQHFNVDQECPLCVQGTALFKIDRARYFLHERRIKCIALPPPYFDSQRKFLGKYGSHPGVLISHVDDPNDSNPRHHAFYVDLKSLMQISEFRAELKSCIQNLDKRPDVVLMPFHPAGLVISEFLTSELGLCVHFHKDLRLNLANEADAALKRDLDGANSLLILDDLAFTGSRMQAYNRSLREANGLFVVPRCIIFFPLIVLAESKKEWGKVKRGIENNHPDSCRVIMSLHEMELPSWSDRDCPWCAEQNLLGMLPSFTDDDSDEQGIRLLNPGGLQEDQWLNVDTSMAVPPFGADSFILPVGASASQILFSCASAVQQLRSLDSVADRLDPHGFPTSVLLDGAVMRHFQNETLIVVGLLRSLKPGELSEGLKNYLRERLHAIVFGDAGHDRWALREFLLAEKRGLIPKVVDEETRAEIYRVASFSSYFVGN